MDTTKDNKTGNGNGLAALLETGGLILKGVVLNSELKGGRTKDGGREWKALETTVLAGKRTVIFSEFEEKGGTPLNPYRLLSPITVDVSSAKMDGRTTIIVSGQVILG